MANFATPSRLPGAQGNVAGSAAFGFGVGDLAFLDSEASKVNKYWREIEHGTSRFVGRALFILPDHVKNALGTPSDLRDALKYLNGTNVVPRPPRVRSDGTVRLGRTVVKTAIQPHDAYSKASAVFDPVAREIAAMEQAFINAGAERGELGGRNRASKAAVKHFLASNLRGAFMSGGVLSESSTKLLQIDKQYRAEMVQANRLLAEALAGEVALEYQQSYVRPDQSTGKLEEATLDPRNRFPV